MQCFAGWLLILAAFSTCSFQPGLYAQSATATLSGTVSDSSGAVLSGARVTATNNATNVSTVGVTNQSGDYLVPNLAFGEYTVSIVHDGFRKFLETKVVLNAGQRFGLSAKLELGQVADSLTVSASAAALDDKTSQISQVFEPAELADIPLGDRRTLQLVELMPAAVFVSYATGAKPMFSLAGGRSESQMMWIDGGDAQNMRLGVGQVDVDPPVEAVKRTVADPPAATATVLDGPASASVGGAVAAAFHALTSSAPSTEPNPVAAL